MPAERIPESKLEESARKLARKRWEDAGSPPGGEGPFLERAREELLPSGRAPDLREAGTSGHELEQFGTASGLPPDPQALNRPLSEDEKVDEASLESMDASDPPAHSSPRAGSVRDKR